MIKQVKGKWHVYSESGKHIGGPYDSRASAEKRLRQIEWFKKKGHISEE
uniref:SPOR domain-containing protein n=1 Tax=viral metagenome TaxID=1070528 RepID=A0A6M3LE22_9ZZZZ